MDVRPPAPRKKVQAGRRHVKKVKGAHVDAVRHQKFVLDPKLRQGPAANRSCTDIICCIIFFLAVCCYIGVFIYGVSQGTPRQLVVPYDTDGNKCGETTGYKDTPLIYFWKVKINWMCFSDLKFD